MESTSKTKRQAKRRMVLLVLGVAVVTQAGCTTLHPVTVAGLRSAVGNTVPGAAGLTLQDQDRIDEHVARACAAGIYTPVECDAHTAIAAERRTVQDNAAGV